MHHDHGMFSYIIAILFSWFIVDFITAAIATQLHSYNVEHGNLSEYTMAMSSATAATSIVQVCHRVPCHCGHCPFQTMERMVIVQHLFQAHSSECNFTYLCGILSCCYTFKPGSTYSGFLTHCNRKHPGWRNHLAECPCTMHDSDDDEDAGDDDEPRYAGDDYNRSSGDTMDMDNIFIEERATMESNEHEESTTHTMNVNVISARFLLNLKERHKLTQVALDYILDAVTELNEVIVNKIKQNVSRKIEELAQESIHDLTSIQSPLNDCFIPTNPFLHLRTEYKQTKFYKEHFGLIVSNHS